MALTRVPATDETDLHIGHYPSLLQSLALGSGYAQKVP